LCLGGCLSEQNRTEQNIYFVSAYTAYHNYKVQHAWIIKYTIKFNNYNLDGINYTIVLE